MPRLTGSRLRSGHKSPYSDRYFFRFRLSFISWKQHISIPAGPTRSQPPSLGGILEVIKALEGAMAVGVINNPIHMAVIVNPPISGNGVNALIMAVFLISGITRFNRTVTTTPPSNQPILTDDGVDE